MPTDLEKQTQDTLQRLRQLRDEIRVELHLAGLEAKDRWHALEPRFADAERFGKEVTDASKNALQEILRSYEELRASLRRQRTT